MFSSRSDGSSVPGYHPEFGLLCPSPRRRRVVRLAVLSVATTIAIGATMGLAVARWPDRDGLAATTTTEPERSQAPAAAVEAARVPESCKPDPADLAAFFLKTACGSSKLHARHGGRAANRVATVIIGRTDMASEPTEVAPPPAAANGPSEVRIAEKPANSAAVERATPKAKTIAPIANTSPAAEMSRWNAMYNSFASTAASRIVREPYDSHGNTYRSVALQSGFADPFSRSWSQWR